MKKLLFVVSLPFVITGCSFGGVEIEGANGGKYTFKKDNIECQQKSEKGNLQLDGSQTLYYYLNCQGTAIEKNLLGQKSVVNFNDDCLFSSNRTNKWEKIGERKIVCAAAEQFGMW